jgi:hypothetical protein
MPFSGMQDICLLAFCRFSRQCCCGRKSTTTFLDRFLYDSYTDDVVFKPEKLPQDN